MPLLPDDAAFLADKQLEYTCSEEGGMTCIVLPNWPLPKGLDHTSVTLLIRLAPGYPDIAPDMWWVDPPLHIADGAEIQATSSMESYLCRTWQRWSRHFNGGQWQPGIDRLESYLALINTEFNRTANGAPA